MRNLVLLLLFCNLCFSQMQNTKTEKLSGAQKTLKSDNCKEITSYAEQDISDKKITIFVQSGMAPKISRTDPTFRKKYGIQYNDLGCIGNKCAEVYNKIIFDYMQKTHGNDWLKTIRADALGLNKWQKKK